MVFKCKSFGLFGIDSYSVDVEASVIESEEFVSFDIVGLPDTSVKESRDRVRTAFMNSGFEFPSGKIVVNLAPADTKKEGPIYDLPIFMAILQSIKKLDTSDSAFLGELSLSGELRPINGVLPMAIKAKECGIKKLYVPADNGKEAALIGGIQVYPVKTVVQLFKHLVGISKIQPLEYDFKYENKQRDIPDFAQVKGQYEVKRAMEIAAAGGHNILLIGPPGSGKSMLAKRVPGILPDMTFYEIIETTKVHSIAGALSKDASLVDKRPFRSPHHTISPVALSGGGIHVKPGEISLANNGVLFLDEFPEFGRQTMEALRQPVEDGVVTVSRANGKFTYPCNFMLIGAMNPCPCGYFNHPTRKCRCSQNQIIKYRNRVSGPMLDRFDIHIEVPPVDYDNLSSVFKEETSAEIKERVDKARKIQNERYSESTTKCNARLTDAEFEKYCQLSQGAKDILKAAFNQMGLSARAYNRIVKVARTIADLDNSENITEIHVAEAIQYRSLDRDYWEA